jgi:hypothetical protein
MTHTTNISSQAKILVIEYSQTGQLTCVVDAILAPLITNETQAAVAAAASGETPAPRPTAPTDKPPAPPPAVSIFREKLRPAPGHEYPYPWPFWRFLDTFPETVAGVGVPLAPLSQPLRDAAVPDFDLVLLAYPVWFLSPPPPLATFLSSEAARRLLRGRKVVTVTACRNMWLMAQDTINRRLRDLGAEHCDHVAITDEAHVFASFITTPRWLLTGRKNAFCGLPPAGIPEAEIAACSRFGRALLAAFQEKARTGALPPTPLLAGLCACEVNTGLIGSERVGIRSFRIWSKLLRACGKPGTPLRRAVLFAYMVFLFTMIGTVVPVTMLAKTLLRPFFKAPLARAKARHEAPSGSGRERM